LTGQSQNKLNDLRAQMEDRVAQPAPSPVAPTPNDTTRSPTAAPAAGPGPATLYKLSFDQMSRGAHSTARSGFQSLLTQYPQSDLAPDAQYYIGETFQAEGNTAAADSVFNLVVSTYPRAPRAATALYKHGLFLQKQSGIVKHVRYSRASSTSILAPMRQISPASDSGQAPTSVAALRP